MKTKILADFQICLSVPLMEIKNPAIEILQIFGKKILVCLLIMLTPFFFNREGAGWKFLARQKNFNIA